MLNWKAHLADILSGLSNTHGKVPLSEIRRILRGVLGVEDIRFHTSDGRELPSELPWNKPWKTNASSWLSYGWSTPQKHLYIKN